MLIAQISDPHLRPRGVLYQGIVDSNAMFANAIAQLNALVPRPDLVILSGDVTDEGTASEYREARTLLADLRLPWMVIPGNHDEREAFRAAFADQGLPQAGPLHGAVEDRGPVRVVGFDITVPGEHHGLVDEAAAGWLEGVLARAPERPTLVMMHQPPFATGIPYVDPYWCREGHRLAAILGRVPGVERIACGHVHRSMLVRFAGTVLCTAPSTATAIGLQLSSDAAPQSFGEPPGFLLHHWTEAAGLVTHLVPIGIFPGPYPFA